jgi:hypothetical protein
MFTGTGAGDWDWGMVLGFVLHDQDVRQFKYVYYIKHIVLSTVLQFLPFALPMLPEKLAGIWKILLVSVLKFVKE